MKTTPTCYPLTRVECETCGWCSESGDYNREKHSALVHSTMLKLGHVTRMTIAKGVEL